MGSVFYKAKEFFRVLGEARHILPALRFKMPDHQDRVSIASVFEDTVAQHPDRLMLIFEGREWTYRAFNDEMNRFAHELSAEGVTRGDTVALFMENRAEFVLSMFAVMKLGASCALINNSLTGRGLVHCVKATNSKHFILGDERREAVEAVLDDINLSPEGTYWWFADTVDTPPPEWATDARRVMEAQPTTNLSITREINAGDVALYIFTSGTTGLPKAAIMLHRKGLAASTVLGRLGFRAVPTDRLYLCLPIYHATGLGPGLLAFMLAGASVFLRRSFSASKFWPEVEEHQTNSFIYVGELCRYLSQQPERPEEKDNHLVKMLGNGLRPDIWDEFKSRFGVNRICEIYGSSEGNVTFANLFNKDKTIGGTFAKVTLVAYDSVNDEIVRDEAGCCVEAKPGEPGLLLGEITKDYAFDGYTNEEATKQKIVGYVVEPGDRWFNTGDLVKEVDVGFALGMKHYQFVDRTGDTFRWRSENVSTNEVAEVLNQHPQIEMANVYGVEVPGVEGKAGMAALAINHHEAFDLDRLTEIVDSELPAFARPVFLRLQRSFETTGTFKLVKTTLRDEAYHPSQVGGDCIYVRPPSGEPYRVLDQSFYERLCAGTAGY